MINTAFVFPGQGSQSVGMLSDFLPDYPIVLNTFKEASVAVGYDLWDLIQNGPEEKLNQTEFTQVAMLTADVAVYRLLLAEGVQPPQLMAGHSLGEYAALTCADALSLTDAAQLVRTRGQVMQNATPLGEGAMAAIVGCDDQIVKEVCNKASDAIHQVTPANYNAIGQVVIAGHTPAVERALHIATQEGALLAKLIPVSVPCHCPLLQEASVTFAEALAKVAFKRPAVDIISNVDLSIYYSAEHIRERLQQQLYSPVRWVETIQLLKKREIEQIIECGPGKVLTGLTKRIDRSLKTINVAEVNSFEQFLEQTQIPA